MRIPVTMCHGICGGERALDVPRFRQYLAMARDLGFRTISYEQLAAWRAGRAELPPRPFLFDVDHPVASVHRELLPLTEALFVVANPIPIKYALSYVGFAVGKPRLPLVEPDEKARLLIESTLRAYSIDIPPAYLQ